MNTPARHSLGQSLGYWIGEEEVGGVIIGAVTSTYQFFHDIRLGDGTIINEPITGKREFETDDEAIAWFREAYPAEYAAGAEMRVWS